MQLSSNILQVRTSEHLGRICKDGEGFEMHLTGKCEKTISIKWEMFIGLSKLCLSSLRKLDEILFIAFVALDTRGIYFYRN